MRKRHILLALLIMLAAISLLQSNARAASELPPVYHTVELIGSTLEESPGRLLDCLFAPIGWSRDGKFAYIAELSSDAMGHCPNELAYFIWVVQDMINDRILWDSGKEYKEGLPEALARAEMVEIFRWELANRMAGYRQHLNRNGIVINSDIRLGKFPLLCNGSEYRAFIVDCKRGSKYGFDETFITGYGVVMAKDSLGKTIGRYPDSCLLDLRIAGYFKSPFEPRIALVVCDVMRGFEGLPHSVTPRFIGCHLESGF